MNRGDRNRLAEAEGYLELELPRMALDTLFRVDRAHQDAFEWHYLAAESYRQLGEFDEALPHLETARRQRPDEIALYINLGWCHKRLGELERAIESLREAEPRCRQRGDKALVYYNLACYYALAQDKPRVLDYLKRALQLDEDYRNQIPDEPDFDSIRDDADFRNLACGQAQRRATRDSPPDEPG